MKKIFSIFLSLVIFSFLTIPNFFAGDPHKRRQKFTQEEDQKLIELVNEHGTSNWVLIASLMENRNPRQCRERWKHYLSVRETRKEPFSPEEDRAISEKFYELGPKWTKIASFLPGRSDIDIKCRFMNFIRLKYNITGVRHSPIRKCNIFLPGQNSEQVHAVSTVQLDLNQEVIVSESLEHKQKSDLSNFELPHQIFEDDYINRLEDNFNNFFNND